MYQWFLKKVEKPLIYGFMLIGVFTVVSFSFDVFVDYIKINYTNETITIRNVGTTERGTEPVSEEHRQEIPRTPTVDERIRDIADQEGFSEVDKLIKVISCESSLRYDEIVDGDYKNYSINPVNNSYDRGFGQYSRKYNPHISDECAFSLTCTVESMIEDVNSYGWGKWNASKGCWDNQ